MDKEKLYRVNILNRATICRKLTAQKFFPLLMSTRTTLNIFPSKNYKTTFKPKIGTEIHSKIAFNATCEKPYILRFLVTTFLTKTTLPLRLRSENLVQFLHKWFSRNGWNFFDTPFRIFEKRCPLKEVFGE